MYTLHWRGSSCADLLLVFLTDKPADCRNRANQNPSCQWFYIPMRMPLRWAHTVKPMPIILQRESAAVGTDPSCIAQVFLFAIVDSLPRRCNALLNRLLSARMILSTQMENSLPTVAISNYCMRGYYMIYEISMHAWFLKSQLLRKDAAVTAWEIKQSAYLLLNLLACLLHTPSRVLHSWLASWIS